MQGPKTTLAQDTISEEELDRIRRELDLEELDRNRLRTILDEVPEDNTNLTYGVVILNTLNEIDYIHATWTQEYRDQLSQQILIECYEKGKEYIFMAAFDVILAGLAGVESIESVYSLVFKTTQTITDIKNMFMTPDQYYEDLLIPLQSIFENRALWHYLVGRSQLGYDHTEAWNTFGPMFPLESRSKWEGRAKSLGDKWAEHLNNIEEIRLQFQQEMREIIYSRTGAKASFTAQPTSGFPPLIVNFDASGSQPSEGATTIESYHWIIRDDNLNTIAETVMLSPDYSYTFNCNRSQG